MKIPNRFRFAAPLTLAALLALAAGPCVEQRSLPEGLGHFRVSLVRVEGAGGGDGSQAAPYDFAADEVTFVFNALAYDRRGRLMDGREGRPSHDRPAAVSVFPGRATGFPGAPLQPATIEFEAGRVEGASIRAAGLYGRAGVLVQDLQVLEGQPAAGLLYDLPQQEIAGSLAMGASRNVYFARPTLAQIQVDPRVLAGDNYDSALPRRFVEIDCRLDQPAPGLPDDGHGKLVVTGISDEGFFVTDLAGAAGQGFNHLYAYNYSYPEDLEVGDRLDRLVGTTQDFSGSTQISFPAWTRAVDRRLDPEPFRVEDLDAAVPPALVTTGMCLDGGGSNQHLCGYSPQNWALEAIESARVRLENLRAPDLYVDCDFNSDGEITFEYPNPDEETACRKACLLRNGSDIITAKRVIARPETLAQIAVEPCLEDADCDSGACGGQTAADRDDGLCRVVCPWEQSIPGIQPNCVQIRAMPQWVCSELSDLNQWGQWVASFDDGSGPLINLITRETLVEFDPTAPENLGLHIEYVQGNLQQVRAARPRWKVQVGLEPNDVPESMRP